MITIDLPMPPSVNNVWHISKNGNGMHISPAYKAWKKEADGLAMQKHALRGHKKINTIFEVEFLFNIERASVASDLDNRIKAALDWLQKRDVISNDNLCMKLTAEWVKPKQAPEGCRVTVRPRA